MTKPIALWFDWTTTIHTPDLRVHASRSLEIVSGSPPHEALATVARVQPHILVFDFDYPDQARLRMLPLIKHAHPGTPILMLTVQHSEGLAVWAFRSRIWNYLVKPVLPHELDENLAALARVICGRTRDARRIQGPAQQLPGDVPVRAAHDPLFAAVYFVEERFREKIRASEVADVCAMSRFAFSREFHRRFGVTFVEYVLRRRVREACRQLSAPGANVTDVAYSVGFNDPSYFGRVFRRYVGLTPTEFVSAERKPEWPAQAPADARALLPVRAVSETGRFAAIATG
jgi:AraC-like DNA-binding protein